MRLPRALLLPLFALAASALLAADPAPAPTPKADEKVAPAIRFPDFGPAPAPAPKPNPGEPQAIPTLTAETLYVIDSDTPFLVFASPPELVTLTKEAGPLRIRGKFIDSPPGSKVETRNFSGKQIITIEANGVGRVEIIAIPAGATEEKSAIRKLIDVNNGAQPPPQPVTSFRVIFVVESMDTLPPGVLAVSDAKAVRDYLTAKCTKEGEWPGWRRYDPDANVANEQPTMKALWAAVKPKLTTNRALVIEVNGKADILPYPANATECLATLKKYAEGK